jgi:tRNA pseudouridine38-40 synthase
MLQTVDFARFQSSAAIISYSGQSHEGGSGLTATREAQAPHRHNIRIVLAYDGTPYLGWQVQPQGPTIQSVIQQCLKTITGEEIFVKGSGRTDAGVHAIGQVANFHTSSSMNPQAFSSALNSLLPPSIAVTGAEEVDESFDAQFSAVGKLYRYRVFNSHVRSPFELLRSWHVYPDLDLDSMSCAASYLIGTLDYSSFRASGCAARNPVRTMSRCNVSRDGNVVLFELEADGFLRHMVRNIVGCLVDVGRRHLSPNNFSTILAARDRTKAGRTAPPHGLYLVRVDYPTPQQILLTNAN